METKNILKYRNAWMGFAILGIMLFHYSTQFSQSAPIVLQGLLGLSTLGFGGVDIFIFASGIGCFYSLFKNENVISFIKRRAVRILPSYEVFIIIWIIFGYDEDGNFRILENIPFTAIIGNILCIQEFTGNKNSFNWYISAIWLMYFLAPYFFGFIKNQKEKIVGNVLLFLVLLLISVAFWKSEILIITISRIPLFYLGMLFAKYTLNKNISKKTISYLFVLMLFGLSALIYCCNNFSFDVLWNYGLAWYPFILIAPGLCLIISIACNLLNKLKGGHYFVSLIEKIGSYSFEIFLIHLSLFGALKYYLNKGFVSNNLILFFSSFAFVLIIAPIYKKCVDGILKLLKFFCNQIQSHTL